MKNGKTERGGRRVVMVLEDKGLKVIGEGR